MLCRHCETRARVTTPMRAWSPERQREPRCARCGQPLTGDDLHQRVREKETQLERFGLAGRTTPITTPALTDEEPRRTSARKKLG